MVRMTVGSLSSLSVWGHVPRYDRRVIKFLSSLHSASASLCGSWHRDAHKVTDRCCSHRRRSYFVARRDVAMWNNLPLYVKTLISHELHPLVHIKQINAYNVIFISLFEPFYQVTCINRTLRMSQTLNVNSENCHCSHFRAMARLYTFLILVFCSLRRQIQQS